MEGISHAMELQQATSGNATSFIAAADDAKI
jgi:hypothetical protein